MSGLARTGYDALVCAIVLQAVKDARGRGKGAAHARIWLANDPWAAELLEGLDVDHEAVRDWVEAQEQMLQPALPM